MLNVDWAMKSLLQVFKTCKWVFPFLLLFLNPCPWSTSCELTELHVLKYTVLLKKKTGFEIFVTFFLKKKTKKKDKLNQRYYFFKIFWL